jgi:hypothetical protein
MRQLILKCDAERLAKFEINVLVAATKLPTQQPENEELLAVSLNADRNKMCEERECSLKI